MTKYVVGSKMFLVLLSVAMLAIMGLSFAPVASAARTPTFMIHYDLWCNNDPYLCPGWVFHEWGSGVFGGGGTWGIIYGNVAWNDALGAPNNIYHLTVTITSWHHAVSDEVYCTDLSNFNNWPNCTPKDYYVDTFHIDIATTCRWGPAHGPYSCDTISNLGDTGNPYAPGHYTTSQMEPDYGFPPTYSSPTFSYTYDNFQIG